MLTAPPDDITLCYLEVVVLPNGEVVCRGKTVGWVNDDLGKYLTPQRDLHQPKGPTANGSRRKSARTRATAR